MSDAPAPKVSFFGRCFNLLLFVLLLPIVAGSGAAWYLDGNFPEFSRTAEERVNGSRQGERDLEQQAENTNQPALQ